jgi:hypothetical protein
MISANLARTPSISCCTLWPAGVVVVVQMHVEQREFTWRRVCRPDWKFLAASILSYSARGSGRP